MAQKPGTTIYLVMPLISGTCPGSRMLHGNVIEEVMIEVDEYLYDIPL